jgi:hypothetical protein
MKSRTTERLRKAFSGLPSRVRRQAKKCYRLFCRDPFHPSLQFKQVHASRPIYSVRISREYRALGVMQGGTVIWFWIGSHSDYDALL